jgi:hypothetical protein
MFDVSILQKHHVALLYSLKDFESICGLLEGENIFSSEDTEDILNKPNSKEKARHLLGRVRTQFDRSFPGFCLALEVTLQFGLLQLIDREGVARKLAKDRGTPSSQIKAAQNEGGCKLCQLYQSSTILQPCGHLCLCFECSKKTNSCPICEAFVCVAINGRL